MTNRLRLSVGIVTYHSRPRILRLLLESLLQAIESSQSDTPSGAFVIVYVVSNDDDGHHIDTVSEIVDECAENAPEGVSFEIIQGHGNVGYGAGQNLALERSDADYHMVLNPDVVLDKLAVVESIRFLEEHAEVAMIVPQGYDRAGDYACLAKRNPTLLVLLLRALSVRASEGFFGRRVGHYIYSDRLPSERPQRIEHASGCFMCCRTAMLRDIGGFDERYFLYFEDYDLSRRISQIGDVYELPQVKISHHGGLTVNRGWRRIGHFSRSAFVFFQQYGWRII